MKKISKTIIVVSIICLAMLFFQRQNDTIPNIKAEYYNISYGNSIYTGMDRVEQTTTKMLLDDYNKIKLIGTTNQEINYDKAICITFVYHNQISGSVTIDDKGICRFADKTDIFFIDSRSSNIYKDGIKAFEELKEKVKVEH